MLLVPQVLRITCYPPPQKNNNTSVTPESTQIDKIPRVYIAMNMGLYMVLDCHEQDLSATMPLALKDSTNHGRLRLWLYHDRLTAVPRPAAAVPRPADGCTTAG